MDTEGPAALLDLEEGHQECRPHTVRILELLKLKYGVSASFFKMYGHARREKGSVNYFGMPPDFSNLEQYSEFLVSEG